MRSSNIIAATALIASALTGAGAWDPSTRDCRAQYSPCLTSFIWCGAEDANKPNDRGCALPEHVYDDRYPEEGVAYPALFWHRSYNISWNRADPNYPVRIQWLFQGYSDTSNVIRPAWEFNTSVPPPTYYTLTLDPSMFPTALNPNLTAAEAIAGASSVGNLIYISQPERPGAVSVSGNFTFVEYDVSSQFSVQPPMNEGYLQVATEKGRHADDRAVRLGVGIGVGLGVPLLLAATAAATWVVASRHARKVARREEKEIGGDGR